MEEKSATAKTPAAAPQSQVPAELPIDSNNAQETSESEDEDEDEEGYLATETIDKGINDVLTALRSGSDKIKDKNFKFFPDVTAEGAAEAQETARKDKPIYLKDYQRSQILQGNQSKDSTVELEEPESYVAEQARVRNDLIKQFHDDDDNSSNDEDGGSLLEKRTEEREIPELELPDPEKNSEAFLNAFISSKAWVPKKSEAPPTYNQIVDDQEEDSEGFDDLSEKFESAYNFRYEDPNAAEIVSYARDQSTLRRDKKRSRQKKRDKEREEREKQKELQKLNMAKLRKTKVNKITDKLAKLQEALGEGEEDVAELLSKVDLEGDFDNEVWDRRMQKLFDEEFYGRGTNDNVDGGYEVDNLGGNEDLSEEIGDKNLEEEEIDVLFKPLSRKELKRKAEKFVESNEDLIVDETINLATDFVYREVEPEAFGLTSRDILLASDKELNQFAGLKKLASYREKEKMDQDRKRYSKRKRLRQWRKEVFGTEDVPTDELWEKAKREEAEKSQAEQSNPKHRSKIRRNR